MIYFTWRYANNAYVRPHADARPHVYATRCCTHVVSEKQTCKRAGVLCASSLGAGVQHTVLFQPMCAVPSLVPVATGQCAGMAHASHPLVRAAAKNAYRRTTAMFCAETLGFNG